MRMTKYKLQLIKESSTNYGGQNINLSSPSEVYRVLCDVCDLDKQAEEVLMLICLDSKNKIIGIHEVSRGIINVSLVSGREIFKRALLNNAAQIILAHNHPSGNPRPSDSDKEVAKNIKRASEILNVSFIDNIIVGDEVYFSFKENNMI